MLKWLRWLHENELGVFPWLLAIGGGLGLYNAWQSGQQAKAAQAQSQSQIDLQRGMQDYIIGRRKNVFDPIEDQAIIPGLMRRYHEGPYFAGEAAAQARELRRPMRLAPAPGEVQ